MAQAVRNSAASLAQLLEHELRTASYDRALEAEYGGADIRLQEAQRTKRRLDLFETFERKFIRGTVLALPLKKPQVSFNPNNLQPFGDHGTVYPTLTLSDTWGTINVTDGALLSSDWSELRVSAKGWDGTSKGPQGWDLELRPSWHVVKQGTGFVITQTEANL
jgi:hypothetical protein